MSDPSRNLDDRQPHRDGSEGPVSPRMSEHPLADSLKRVVRRILRTQTRRTEFEARVLDEARRLVDGHYCEMARDAFERLVVSRVLRNPDDSHLAVLAGGAGTVCPPTHLRVSHSTVGRQAFDDRSLRR